MELLNQTQKEKFSDYKSQPGESSKIDPSGYLKDYMDFMTGLGSDYTSEKKEETLGEPVVNKLSGSSREFMKHFGKLIGDTANSIGLSGDMVLAQVALETGWGKHMPGNNIGGIKADSSWKGKTQELMTTEYSPEKGNYKVKQTFRAYNTPEEGVKGYFEFLAKNKRYKPLFGVKDPYDAVDIMAKTGYASDSTYKPKLYDMVKQIQELQA